MTLPTLRAYAPWMLREIVPRALVPMVLFGFFVGIPIYATVHSQRSNPEFNPEALGRLLTMAYVGTAPLACTLGAFLFMTRSIAEDRERQYVRFLFSHAVAPAQFYLTRYVVGMLTFLLFFLPVPLVVRHFGGEAPVAASLLAMTVTLVFVGGLTTLCAALVNKEGLALIVVYAGSQLLQRLRTQDVLVDWLDPVAQVLPPVGALGTVVDTLVRGGAWPTNELILVVGYGLGLLAAGLLVLRRAPLVR